MKRLTLLLLLGSAPALFAQKGFIQLFNGKDFTGWKVGGDVGVTDPSWSRDGSRVAYVSIFSGDGQLYAADVVSGARTQLTADGPPKSSPSWSGSGN